MERARLLLLVVLMITHFNAFAQNEETGLYVGDVSNSGCKSLTRSESVRGHSILKLTRDGDNIIGELTDFYANCAASGIAVKCEQKEQTLDIIAAEYSNSGDMADCICPYDVYFTIFNAKEEQYGLVLNGEDLGNVSFKDHSVVEIDLSTLEHAYEEGFEYPVKVGYFSLYEMTPWIQPGEITKPEFIVYFYDDLWRQDFVYTYYRLPNEYTYLNAQARLEADSTLVIDIITDGGSTVGSERLANLTIDIINVEKQLCHIRLNHKVVTIGDDGMTDKEVLTLFDGYIDCEDGQSTIELKELAEYRKETTQQVSPLTSRSADDEMLYDLLGRRISASLNNKGKMINDKLRKGLYIKNGRKIVVK